jgi:hypothetical protein
LSLSVRCPASCQIVEGQFEAPRPDKAQSDELRVLEFELIAPSAEGPVEIPGYAVYELCETETGTCRTLRSDWRVRVTVDAKAPRFQ